jgi:DNA-directed RNA polymerase specialized sigma24 family protein
MLDAFRQRGDPSDDDDPPVRRLALKSSEHEAGARSAARRPRWVLNRGAFEGLLSSLHPDEEHAAREYERLRERLILFFSGRRCAEPEESADETLDRLSRRIDEGEPIRDVTRFAYGVARLVLSESYRRVRRRRRLLTDMALSNAPTRWDDSVRALASDAGVECIRRCADRLPPEERDLILRYYENGGRDRQEERKVLAARLGLSPVALRLRAFRIRRVLESCTRDCLAGRPAERT